jgi:hypothetical protein
MKYANLLSYSMNKNMVTISLQQLLLSDPFQLIADLSNRDGSIK